MGNNGTKRLTGKKKLVALTPGIEADMRSYCREKRIGSESELVRQALVHYMDREYDDDTFKLSVLKDVRESLGRLLDMVSVLFSYQHMMHLNLLAYHPEITGDFKGAAFSSAEARLDKFFDSFRDRLADDPAFFERLLRDYVAGAADG